MSYKPEALGNELNCDTDDDKLPMAFALLHMSL
jgi:hypothetical protein